MVPLEENDVKQFQTYSECCSSDTIMKWIKWFLELTNHPFTWNDLREHIMDKLGVQIKPHIIRRLLRDRFTKRYKKGSCRPTKINFKKHWWTGSLFWTKLLGILSSLKMIINVDGWCFSRSVKQNYSWLDKGRSCWLHNAKYTGSASILSAISTDGTHFTAIYSWTVNANIFIHFVESLFMYLNKKMGKILSKSLIIMDNCPYQKSKIVLEKLKYWKINWIYLPPYTPELAPIELLFRSLKAKLRICDAKGETRLSSQRGIDVITAALRQIKSEEITGYWNQFFNEIKSIINFIYLNR